MSAGAVGDWRVPAVLVTVGGVGGYGYGRE